MTEPSASTPALGWHPSDFALEGTDGRHYRLAEVRGAKGTLIMFICNHCVGSAADPRPRPRRASTAYVALKGDCGA
jgi:hypothetical protein